MKFVEGLFLLLIPHVYVECTLNVYYLLRSSLKFSYSFQRSAQGGGYSVSRSFGTQNFWKKKATNLHTHNWLQADTIIQLYVEQK